MAWCGMDEVIGLVVGARSGIGAAFVHALDASDAVQSVYALGRDGDWCAEPSSGKVRRIQADITSEASLASVAERLASDGAKPNFIINCSGLLHAGDARPERRLRAGRILRSRGL